MSTINTVIQAVKTQLEGYSGLNYIRSFDTYEDEFELEDAGKFPYINIDINDFRVSEASNMNRIHYERHTYPVIILFSCRNKIKREVKKGTGNFKGLFDIYEDIKNALYSDLTFSGAVMKFPIRPDFATDVSKHPNSEFWIGRAVIIFELYNDICLLN